MIAKQSTLNIISDTNKYSHYSKRRKQKKSKIYINYGNDDMSPLYWNKFLDNMTPDNQSDKGLE